MRSSSGVVFEFYHMVREFYRMVLEFQGVVERFYHVVPEFYGVVLGFTTWFLDWNNAVITESAGYSSRAGAVRTECARWLPVARRGPGFGGPSEPPEGGPRISLSLCLFARLRADGLCAAHTRLARPQPGGRSKDKKGGGVRPPVACSQSLAAPPATFVRTPCEEGDGNGESGHNLT